MHFHVEAIPRTCASIAAGLARTLPRELTWRWPKAFTDNNGRRVTARNTRDAERIESPHAKEQAMEYGKQVRHVSHMLPKLYREAIEHALQGDFEPARRTVDRIEEQINTVKRHWGEAESARSLLDPNRIRANALNEIHDSACTADSVTEVKAIIGYDAKRYLQRYAGQLHRLPTWGRAPLEERETERQGTTVTVLSWSESEGIVLVHEQKGNRDDGRLKIMTYDGVAKTTRDTP